MDLPADVSPSNTHLLVLPAKACNPFGRLSNVRGCGFADEAISLMKYFRLTENGANLRFGVDFFNILNRKHFGNPAATYGNSNFGAISGAGPARTMQLQMKVIW